MPEIILPFEVDFNLIEFIQCEKVLLGAMKVGSKEEKSALEKLLKELIQKDGHWGIEIPRRWGFTLKERRAIEESIGLSKAARRQGLELMRRINQETGIPIQDISQYLDAGNFEAAHEIYGPYLDQILDLVEELQKDNSETEQVTLLVKRAIPKWSAADSEALPERIFDRIANLAHRERTEQIDENGEVGKDTEMKPMALVT